MSSCVAVVVNAEYPVGLVPDNKNAFHYVYQGFIDHFKTW